MIFHFGTKIYIFGKILINLPDKILKYSWIYPSFRAKYMIYEVSK